MNVIAGSKNNGCILMFLDMNYEFQATRNTAYLSIPYSLKNNMRNLANIVLITNLAIHPSTILSVLICGQ